MLRIAIAEDEAEYRMQLTEFLRQYGENYSVEMEISCFSNGADLVQDYQPEYDIILLDIAMPDLDGMEAARRIRQVDEQVVLVFITQMAQYAINGYEVGALDFLLKPVNYDVFAMKLTKAIRRAESREGKRIVLTLQSGVQVLQTRDIYYVEIQNHVLHYHTNQGEFSLRGTMQKAQQELEPYHFSRCSNWCLVNLAYVSQVDKSVAVVAGTPLDISRRNRTTFMAALTRYMGGNT
ncbi:MAG: LytTR family DNA-binding domain-containing protein [Clostridiales bacterium]|nr:LytTR family DNA-binding domain-containing protein [Clostridiales bacterium]